MKKLLLLLILSSFSTQSFAGSCPDGSDPVRSISEDGTYFVYNCGGSLTIADSTQTATKIKHHGVEHILNTDTNDWHKFDTSITVGYTSSPPTQTYSYSSFDNIVDPYGRIIDSREIPERWTNLKTPLVDIEIPEDWKLIDDYDRYQEIISLNAAPRLGGFQNNPPKDNCIHMFKNFKEFRIVEEMKGHEKLNSRIEGKVLEKFTNLDEECRKILQKSIKKMATSMRGVTRILRVARTIADLEESEKIHQHHLLEAISYRRKI